MITTKIHNTAKKTRKIYVMYAQTSTFLQYARCGWVYERKQEFVCLKVEKIIKCTCRCTRSLIVDTYMWQAVEEGS